MGMLVAIESWKAFPCQLADAPTCSFVALLNSEVEAIALSCMQCLSAKRWVISAAKPSTRLKT